MLRGPESNADIPYRFIQPDLGNEGASFFGMAEAPVPAKDSAEYFVAEVSILLTALSIGC